MTSTAPTNADYDLVTDAAYCAGLAITEATGSLAPIMTHAPSLHLDDAGLLSFRLYLPRQVTPHERTVAVEALLNTSAHGHLARVESVGYGVDDRGRETIDVVGANRADAPTWAMAARRRITPGNPLD